MPMTEESSSGPSEAQTDAQVRVPSLEDCLKLLRGERDEQRLAGLLLVTKFCNKDDFATVRQVYDAIGPQFLHRLLRTELGKGDVSCLGAENRDVYLPLSVTIISAFCRVPEIAASSNMISSIPVILKVIQQSSDTSLIEECYEYLLLVSTAHEDGVRTLYESGGIDVLASQVSSLPDESHTVELSIRLFQLIISKFSLEKIISEYPSEFSIMVAVIAKQFAVSHRALKFEALHLLTAILSSTYSAPVHNALRSKENDIWSAYIRVGVVAILQDRVAPADKIQTLILAESVISIAGEGWLIGRMNFPDIQDLSPVDRCILLVSESSRIEIAVLLNELAYLKYEASKASSSNAESFSFKLRNVGVAFSLVESVIKLISNVCDNEDCVITESTITKIISGLNETIDVVLDYLKDAKDHGQKKGDDLVASVRIIGSYLAETPQASREKVGMLLGYMLSVEGEDESSPFNSVCFLLPMLCQATMKIDGCKLLAFSGAYKAVVEYLTKVIGLSGFMVDNNYSIFLSCDTILNLLLKREQIQFCLDDALFIELLGALSHWAEDTGDLSVIMMASSISALVFDSTSEEALLSHPYFDRSNLLNLYQLIIRSLAICGQDMMSEDAEAEGDRHQIVASAYSRWADRFPYIKEVVEG